ncbi:MAG: superoxide dismutase family protein [Chloroflexi bacterium]|nr:superoxide dismutase family protein [Chloroflexota bacterium]
MKLLVLAVALTLTVALQELPTGAGAQVVAPTASADVRTATGDQLATATFAQAADEVRISIAFHDRAALVGTHAIHIDAAARCNPPNFDAAGAIFNPTGKQHGLLNPNGPMAGDLPNLVISPAGVAVYNLSAALVTVGPGTGTNSLLGGQGTSLVVFAQPDDDMSQPEGNAGPRIACGPIVAGVANTAPSVPALSATTVSSTGTTDRVPTALILVMGGLLIAGGVLLRRSA